MKTLKLSLMAVVGAFFMVTAGATAQTAVKPAAATVKAGEAITWKDTTHDFAKIVKGTPVSHEFSFKNTTKQTILISNVKASCGCTATNYTKTPIKPGETGTVTATYNAAAPGAFTKTVTVTTNDVEPVKVLTIKGTVADAS